MKRHKTRLDLLVVARGLFPSRETARRAIMAGNVSSRGEVLDKPGTSVPDDLELHVRKPEHNYVSRGGLKLERALRVFDYILTEKVVLDVGASTGGFTDCALQNGAKHVYAVDVGYGQLAWTLRNDPRVTVMERTNFRHVAASAFPNRPDVAVMDVSFISTRLLLPKLAEVLAHGADVLSLVKPQFEAGRDKVGKGGIVRDAQVHLDVLVRMCTFVVDNGWSCSGLDYSPISGGDGNVEFLAQWTLRPSVSIDWSTTAKNVVIEAWKILQGQDVTDLIDPSL